MILWTPFPISYQLCCREWNPLLEEFAFSLQATLDRTEMKIHAILPLCIVVLFASGYVSGILINKHKLDPIFVPFSANQKMSVTHLTKILWFHKLDNADIYDTLSDGNVFCSPLEFSAWMHSKKLTKNFNCIRLGQKGSNWTIINIGGALFAKIAHKSVNFSPAYWPLGCQNHCKSTGGDVVKITEARENVLKKCGQAYATSVIR